jgi:hypothetical protein
MVKGRIYRLANLDKNKRNNLLVSYNAGQKDDTGWLWTSSYHPSRDQSVFREGDAFVCLGKKEHDDNNGQPYYGITTWYEAAGPDGKIHKITPSMRSTYFRSP